MTGLTKQARYLNERQTKNAVSRMSDYRNALRNTIIIQLTMLAGLRAKEVSFLRWEHILDGHGQVADEITLTNDITKGKSGGKIPLNETLRQSLVTLWQASGREAARGSVIKSERGEAMRTQSVVNLLFAHYRKCDIQGASSHSGRRTFITNLARKISLAGGSMRDVQALARHSNLQTTQRYVEQNSEAQKVAVRML